MELAPPSAHISRSDRLLLGVFFLSGFAGLVYQVVWMRMLVRVFGGTVLATSTVIAVFMGGLALGAAMATRWRRTSARTYAIVEVCIAGAGLLSTFGISLLSTTFAALAPPDTSAHGLTAIRMLLSALFLLPPTTLMGMTLPFLVGATRTSPGRALAELYTWNTYGAVVGTIATGFVGLALLGERATILCAVVLNLALGALVLRVRPSAPEIEPTGASASSAPTRADPSAPAMNECNESRLPEVVDVVQHTPRLALIVTAISGFTFLALEVAWTRMLVLVLGTSVYAFSTMLAAFLVGIALGSTAAIPIVDRIRNPGRLLGITMTAAGASVLVGLRVFLWICSETTSTKYLYSPLVGANDILTFAAVGLVVLVPSTFLFGLLFPMCGRALIREDLRARQTGWLVAINTICGVLGALMTGFILLPHLTAQGTVLACACVLLLAGAVVSLTERVRDHRALLVVLLLFAVGALSNPRDDIVRATLGRRVGSHQILVNIEGRDATTTVVREDSGRTHLLLNGVHTSSRSKVGELMAHLPLLLQAAPKRAMVICLGVGDTVSATVEHLARVDENYSVTLVEMVKEVVEAQPLLNPRAAEHLKNSHVRVVVNDGRNELLRARDPLDLVIFDGTPPLFSSGAVNLYSRDFAELVAERLSDTGVFMLWIPLPAFADDHWAILRGLSETFPHLRVWAQLRTGVIALASKAPIDVDHDLLERRIKERGLSDSDPWMTPDLIVNGIVPSAFIDTHIRDVAPVTDNNPLTEQPLGKLLRGMKLENDSAFYRQADTLKPTD